MKVRVPLTSCVPPPCRRLCSGRRMFALVGEHCPAEVVAEIGGERRCGVCPLACKCIEHLPAIVAKQRQLLERIQGSREAYNRLAQRKTEVSELGEIYDAIDADFQDYMGWRLAEEILEDIHQRFGSNAEMLHAADPEIIRQHLSRVVKASSQQEFILRRIVEPNEYPTLATEVVPSGWTVRQLG
jgi:hypothetical protein